VRRLTSVSAFSAPSIGRAPLAPALSFRAVFLIGEENFMRLKFDRTALNYSHALAAAAPYPGKSNANSAAILDEHLDGIVNGYQPARYR
jgi:hypothetical protein